MNHPAKSSTSPSTRNNRGALLFDLDGTLVDSVYQHVLAWREALEKAGIELSVWRIHRRIGMSGGLFINALLRETVQTLTLRRQTSCGGLIRERTNRQAKRISRCLAPLHCSDSSAQCEKR